MFGAVKLSKNGDPDNYSYSGYGIRFDSPALFLCPSFDLGENVVIYEVDNVSSVHTDNRKRDILVLGEGQAQLLDSTTLTTEVINFV